MEDFRGILVMFKLKEVYRSCHVLDRKESSAEHTWGSMILADYFMTKMKMKIDRAKVMDILLYHDLVEVEAGDTYVHDKKALESKDRREKQGLEALKKKMPKELVKKYVRLYSEYKGCRTIEAKFANAIDKLDPIIHSLKKKDSWSQWDLSETDIRDVKEKHVAFSKEFTQILNDLINYLKRNDLISY